MWRQEVTDSGSYIPKNAITEKISTFNLDSFIKKVMGLKSDFSLYLGSATTPPCQGTYYF
jgi:carbonic anhydrase